MSACHHYPHSTVYRLRPPEVRPVESGQFGIVCPEAHFAQTASPKAKTGQPNLPPQPARSLFKDWPLILGRTPISSCPEPEFATNPTGHRSDGPMRKAFFCFPNLKLSTSLNLRDMVPLVIDNYDSFTANLSSIGEVEGGFGVRNDQITP
jgi:hypothetical protein